MPVKYAVADDATKRQPRDGSRCGTRCNAVMRAAIIKCRVDNLNNTSEPDNQIRPRVTLRKEFSVIFNLKLILPSARNKSTYSKTEEFNKRN